MKSYTDIEQSKKLAKILPPETADMGYLWNGTSFCEYPVSNQTIFNRVENIPCWSLAALLDILSEKSHSINEDGAVCLDSYKCIEWDLSMENTNLGCVTKSNPVDACVTMIKKLHEQNLL